MMLLKDESFKCLWTKGITIPQIRTFRNNEALKSLREASFQLDQVPIVLDNFDRKDKREIISWVSEFQCEAGSTYLLRSMGYNTKKKHKEKSPEWMENLHPLQAQFHVD